MSISERLREGICDDRCRVMDAASGCECAKAADVIEVLVEALSGTTASLVAAISLLERGGKKAAPSDTMFEMMLADYRKAVDAARAALARTQGHTAMSHEPTKEELRAFINAPRRYEDELAAANAIRDKRIRAEALEEALRVIQTDVEGPAGDWDYAVQTALDAIRALKDKTDDPARE